LQSFYFFMSAVISTTPRPTVRLRFLFLTGLAGLLSGCGHALTEIPGFDAAMWRSDPYACRDKRRAAVPVLIRAKEQLYEARANDVTALLGPPDEEELRAGTEKVYYYYLEPGTQCEGRRARSGAASLSIRFGPIGTVTEVLSDPLSTTAKQ
jgi:hypothetical protein